MYEEIKRFINKAEERRFNDALMRMTIVEIKLRSGDINEHTIMPRYYNKGCRYDGMFYEQSGTIKQIMPQKALSQLKAVIKEGSKIPFFDKSEIKNWLVDKIGISHCSLSV